MYGAADRRSYGVALEGRLGQAYNEEAFRYFLEIERRRAVRARRPVRLLLLDLKRQARYRCAHRSGARRQAVLGAVALPPRDRRHRLVPRGRVAAAVLNQLEDGPQSDVSDLIRQRVTGALCKSLSSDIARRSECAFFNFGRTERLTSCHASRNIVDRSR